jgi:Sulfotransferase family
MIVYPDDTQTEPPGRQVTDRSSMSINLELRPPRRLPALSTAARARRPMSFVTVRFSDDFEHNLDRSSCVHDPLNELIVVDNRGNLFFDSLSAAFEEGVRRARCDVVALVHEDVVLVDGWQAAFERSLVALERQDSEWGLVGTAGSDVAGSLAGHWSDPHGYYDLLGDASHLPVRRIDEQLMAFRRSRPIPLDSALPGIHNVGFDLALSLARLGLRTYVVDAPTLHKYADARGRPIHTGADSPKIVARGSLTWIASKAVSDDYFFRKWPGEDRAASKTDARQPLSSLLEAPVVLIGRGGGGTRLLGTAATDAGLFIGNELNASSDSIEMASAVYKAVLVCHRETASWQQAQAVSDLRAAAGAMLARAGFPPHWGFKLPESLLALDAIDEAFPKARYVHLVRDPIATCLRRTHMSSRLDNEIGQTALRAAYRAEGRDLARALDDPPALRMAYTTSHQLNLALTFGARFSKSRWREMRFEALLRNPAGELASLARWLGLVPTGSRLQSEVDPVRAAAPPVVFSEAEASDVKQVLSRLHRVLGYGRNPDRPRPGDAGLATTLNGVRL